MIDFKLCRCQRIVDGVQSITIVGVFEYYDSTLPFNFGMRFPVNRHHHLTAKINYSSPSSRAYIQGRPMMDP